MIHVAMLLERFAHDPIIALERRDPPTHAHVCSIHHGVTGRPVVVFELIDAPPPPREITYEGAFEPTRLPVGCSWFVFEPSLGLEVNLRRLVAHVRSAVAIQGRKPAPPRAAVEPPPLGASFSSLAPITSASRAAPPPPEPPPPPSFEPFESTRGSAPLSEPPSARPRRPPSASRPPPAPDSAPGTTTQRIQRASPSSAPASPARPRSERPPDSRPAPKRPTSPPRPSPKAGPPEPPPPPRPFFGDDD